MLNRRDLFVGAALALAGTTIACEIQAAHGDADITGAEGALEGRALSSAEFRGMRLACRSCASLDAIEEVITVMAGPLPIRVIEEDGSVTTYDRLEPIVQKSTGRFIGAWLQGVNREANIPPRSMLAVILVGQIVRE